jgi:DNA-directed RNA polymerase subunit omega
MLNVDLSRSLGNYSSRYSLVIAIAKRARELTEKADYENVRLKQKSVTLAINELVGGRLVVMEPDSPQEMR